VEAVAVAVAVMKTAAENNVYCFWSRSSNQCYNVSIGIYITGSVSTIRPRFWVHDESSRNVRHKINNGTSR
jgi:hypothetical protein